MIAAAGGKSLFGDVDVASLPEASRNVNIYTVEPEDIAKANPDVVLRLTPAVLAAVPEDQARGFWHQLRPVRRSRIAKR